MDKPRLTETVDREGKRLIVWENPPGEGVELYPAALADLAKILMAAARGREQDRGVAR